MKRCKIHDRSPSIECEQCTLLLVQNEADIVGIEIAAMIERIELYALHKCRGVITDRHLEILKKVIELKIEQAECKVAIDGKDRDRIREKAQRLLGLDNDSVGECQ